MDTRDWLKEQLDKLSEEEYAELWNKYCEANEYEEEMLHPMEEFNEFFKNCTPLELVEIGNNSGFGTVDDNWFRAKGIYGWEVETDDDPRYLTEEDDLLDWVEENASDFTDILDDTEYRKTIKEGWPEDEWAEFESWFDEEYGCYMFELDIEVLKDEWAASEE